MADATFTFPEGFLWGTATAGYQVEGFSTTADFWNWEPPYTMPAGGLKPGRACDWWEGRRWQEDFDRAANDGHSALRLSIEWSRVEPREGEWDEAALAHYREMLAGLRQRGLEPMVTLHHYASPAWAVNPERNAWESGEAAALFERYVTKVVGAVGDLVGLYCTLNEPNALAFHGWGQGTLPPYKKDFRLLMRALETMVRAHARAYSAIHALHPEAQVGVANFYLPIVPATPGFWPDEWVTRKLNQMLNHSFYEAAHTGRLRQIVGPARLIPEARGTQDFVALQYYTTNQARFDLSNPGELFGRRTFPPGAEPDQAGYYASYPPGFMRALRWVKQFGLPIYVTECGIGDAEDGLRRRFLVSHLRELWRAVNFNWDVRGFFHWTLVDNYEWERGWTHRFGLYALDPETQVRTPRPSAALYSEIARTGSLSSDMVAHFAPTLVESMFPG